MDKPRIIVICGPTASGKTACAVDLCKRIGGEVVSADSMQIYKGMDIGTAKPNTEERGGIPHFMLDVAEPAERYSAAAYREKANECIREILARGHMPVLCGGTGLYIDAVIKPMSFSIQSDDAVRNELTAIAEEENGKERLHAMLSDIDPASAARLHMNNTRRVIRALEVYRLTGKRMSEHLQEDAVREGDYDAAIFALDWPRDVLYARIDARVDEMIAAGLVSEVRALLAQGLSEESTAMQALGYKEVVKMLKGEISMDEATELIKRGTRNYAKRQLTWFRRDKRVRWIEAAGKSAGDISREIMDVFDIAARG